MPNLTEMRRLQDEWRRGRRPSIVEWVKESAADTPLELAKDLSAVELQLRIKVGEPARVDHYLEQFPELESRRDLLLPLISAECTARFLQGEMESWIESYRRRFPRYASEITPEFLADSLPRPRGSQASPIPRLPQRLGPYRLVEEIGRGAFGVVYRSIDTRTEVEVAVKIPFEWDDSEIRRLKSEAKNATMCAHPGIVPVLDMTVDEGKNIPYVVFKLCTGLSLEKQIKLGRKFTPRDASLFMADVADALQAAHAKGITHRDLKPANILQDEVGRPLLIDFGLALREGATVTGSVMAVGEDGRPNLIGTPAYMAPEQIQAIHKPTPAVDIFACGIILYQLLTREHPFQGTSVMIMRGIEHLDPMDPCCLNPEVSPKLRDICLKALNKDPKQRFRSAEGMAGALRTAAAAYETELDLPPRSIRRKPRRASIRLCLLLVLLAVVEGVAIAYLAWQTAQPRPMTRDGRQFLRQDPSRPSAGIPPIQRR
jgi:serine/threonine protein kinase